MCSACTCYQRTCTHWITVVVEELARLQHKVAPFPVLAYASFLVQEPALLNEGSRSYEHMDVVMYR